MSAGKAEARSLRAALMLGALAGTNLDVPVGVGPRPRRAYEAIASVLLRDLATDTGGCRAFYSAQEWTLRGEQYGRDSLLIVVYDGGDLVPYFRSGVPVGTRPARFESMRKALEAVGMYAEECTHWYSAVYAS